MKTLFIVLALVITGDIAQAAEAAKPKPDLVNPAEYRILVKYDKYTNDMIRQEIEKTIKEALEERRRRLKLSDAEMRRQLRKELRRFEDELRAIRKARQEEEAARRRQDLTEAEKWRLLRLERTRRALELARRARLIEDALLAMSLENWRVARRKERLVAEKALRRLERLLDDIKAKEDANIRERGRAVPPPHR